MKHKIALLALFLAPGIWGAASLGGALTASTEVVCPGENVGDDGEEHPGPMRPGDVECSVLDGGVSVANRTYGQQQRVQSLERRDDAVSGTLLLAYGVTGGLLVWRAGQTARR